MRDEAADPVRRDEMAKSAAPYVHAKPAPEDRQGKTVPPMIYVHPPLEADGSDVEGESESAPYHRMAKSAKEVTRERAKN